MTDDTKRINKLTPGTTTALTPRPPQLPPTYKLKFRFEFCMMFHLHV